MTLTLPNIHEYTAVHGLMRLLQHQNNYPDPGSGAHVLSAQARNLLGPNIPDVMVGYTVAMQYNLFGDYPFTKDIAPSAVFTALFGLVLVAHLTIFTINYSRGHYFWPQIGFIIYAICRLLGFALRIAWSHDLSNTGIGVTGEVFLILPTVLLPSYNLILAQRIFTWRHPVGGSRRLFWNLMLTLYAVVAGVVAMTIVASTCMNIYLLGAPNFQRYIHVIQASSILIITYSLTAVALIALAFFFKPTRKDENLCTYQPWWIESFSPFYFVRKGEPQEAAMSFLKRNHNHRFAIRVIAATHHHYKMVKGLTTERGDLTHNTSMMIIAATTLIILIGAILRSVVCFQARIMYERSAVGSAAMMYVWWGGLEIVVNILYLVGRVDLRFYRPDRLPKHIQHINTAEQSLYPSEIESTVDIDEHGRVIESGNHSIKEEDYDTDKTNESRNSGDTDEFYFYDGPAAGGEDTSFSSPESQYVPDINGQKGSRASQLARKKPQLPYPNNEKSDAESDFQF